MRVLDFPSTDFSKELAKKYGYDEFIIRRWVNFFGEEETAKLVEGMENVPKYIRVNTIKISEEELVERLEERGFVFEKTEVPFCYEVVEEPYSIGATPEFLMGFYYVMDKSSCIPPIELNPRENDLVVDMAASPGGKATMISMLMKNRGILIAIEGNEERIPPLIDNIHRMGAMNTIVLRMNSARFHNLGIKADKILLDAPCTGEGIIHKDPTRKWSRGAKDILFCTSLQKQMLESGIKSLKPGGVLVYSTCSLTPEENELVIEWALKNFDIKLEEVGFGEEALTKIGDIKLSSELRKAKRLYPHKHRCSGFFVAKIVKGEDPSPETSS